MLGGIVLRVITMILEPLTYYICKRRILTSGADLFI